MADVAQIRSVVERYTQTFGQDREAWIALFAEDATMEDPVGSDVIQGHDAIGTFFDNVVASVDSVRLELTGLVRVAGLEAAFPMEAHSEVGGAEMVLPIIDVMTFDDDARLTSMRAFWDMADMGPAD